MAKDTSFQPDDGVIAILQEDVSAHLTAIEQYTGQFRHLDRWGYAALGKHFHHESRGERGHWKALLTRLEFFDIEPTTKHEQPDWPRHDVPGILRANLALEETAAEIERRGASAAEEADDYGTAHIFRKLLKDSEASVAELEAWLQLIEQMTLPNFLQAQM